MAEFSPEWGDYASQLGIDMYDMADASSERLSAPIPVHFTSTTGNIVSIAFIPYAAFLDEGILYVAFHSGEYRYFDVPLDVAMGFESAPSATAYLNEAIKDQFEYEGM